MLDINLLRENPEKVKKSVINRGKDEKIVDEFLKLDENWRELKKKSDELRAYRNKLSKEINQAKKSGKDVKKLIKKAKEIPKKLEKAEKKLNQIEKQRREIWKKIPNLVDKSVPIGDESKNKVIKKYGKTKKGEKAHADIMENMDLIDTEKASFVSGARFYYLKRELVKLNLAIINFAIDFLYDKNFILMQPPYMLRREILEGAINYETFEDAIYKIENEDLYLIGTAEHALNAYKSGEVINPKELPLRFAGISPCFRKEAGAHGKDTKGIFRTHQFEKVEQFVFCKPSESWKEYELILNNTIEMFKQIGIPFRTVILSSEDMGSIPTKTIDLEGWFPSQNQYRELASCSNCLDYQARRSNTRFQDGNELNYVHTLNNTAIATERMMTCIVENFVNNKGEIEVPKVLQKYTGFKIIKPVKN